MSSGDRVGPDGLLEEEAVGVVVGLALVSAGVVLGAIAVAVGFVVAARRLR